MTAYTLPQQAPQAACRSKWRRSEGGGGRDPEADDGKDYREEDKEDSGED